MGFTTPNFPAVEPEAFLASPFLERVKTLTLNWVDNGYGVPRMVHAIYIVKLVLFYAVGGIVVATVTSGSSGVLACFGVVEPADRLPEGNPVDGAAGNHRRRRVLGPAGRQDQADDGRHPVLGPARHDQAAAVAARPVHRRQPSDLVRRRRSTWP